MIYIPGYLLSLQFLVYGLVKFLQSIFSSKRRATIDTFYQKTAIPEVSDTLLSY